MLSASVTAARRAPGEAPGPNAVWIASIQGREIEDFLIDLEKSSRTKNVIIDTWNMVFAEAERLEYIAKPPKIQRFKKKSTGYDIFTDEELELLFPDDRDELVDRWTLPEDTREREPLMWAVMCLTAVTTGMRSGEIRALHRDQVDRKSVV